MRSARPFALCALSAIFAGAALAQQPSIARLQNNYSYIQPGLPNYGIAQGSVFDIFGTNLAAAAGTLQSVPLQTTVNGVSANVTVNGTTVPLLLYFVSPTQIAAILPSRTPVGTGQITVTRGGVASAPAPIQVVASAFGILTLNGVGSGAAAAFDVNANYLGFTNAVNPGEYVTLWGSGVGPAQGDETNLQTPQDLANIPIEVDIGGVPATVAYHGRSVYPGLDQINVIVPDVQGCFVSVVVRTGNIVSNFASIPVAASGRICSDVTTGFTASALQSLAAKTSYTTGNLNIGKTVNTPGAPAIEFGNASFNRIASSQFSATHFAGLGASMGSCAVYQRTGVAILAPDPNTSTSLNAGPSITVKGPSGSRTLPRIDLGNYTALLAGGPDALPSFIPSTGGIFTFDNGPGGPDIGPFTAQITVGSPFVWSNQSSITTVNRSQGPTITWTGGDPNSYVAISGGSSTGGNSPVGAYFNCTAPVAARQFTIPAAVMLALPASPAPADGNSFLLITNTTYPRLFTAAGLDLGLIVVNTLYTATVNFQ